jgi:hypothetical protein
MVGIKVFECALCKQEVQTGVKNSRRTYGTRKEIRQHLREIHHINRKAGTPEHKGNRTQGGKDNRSSVTQNCILYKEF